MAISEGRKAMIEEDAKGLGGGGGSIWNYVDKQRAEELGLHQYRTKKGDNFIRIVAPSVDEPFRMIVWRHQKVGANENTYLCMKKMYEGENCPICDLLATLKMEDPKNPALDTMYAARRVLMYVVDTTDEETMGEGPKWFDCPPSVYTAICALAKTKRTGEIIDIACPDDGCNIIFERQQKKGNPYCGFEREEPSQIPEEWFADLPAYEDILLIPDAEDIETQLSGVGPGTREESKEKRGGRTRRGTSSTSTSRQRSRGTSASEDEKPAASSSRRSRRTSASEDSAEETPASERRARRDSAAAKNDPPFDPDVSPQEEEVDEKEAVKDTVGTQEEGSPKVRSRLDEIRERRKANNG